MRFNKDSIKSYKKGFKEGYKKFKNAFGNAKRIHSIAYVNSRFTYVGLMITIVLISLLPFVNSWFSGKVIDELVLAASSGVISETLIFTISIYIGTMVFLRIVGIAYNYFIEMNWLELYGIMTIKMQKVFGNLDLYHHEDPKFNDVIQKAREGYSNRPANYLQKTINVISDLISMASAIFIILKFSPFILLIIIVSLLPTFINQLIFGNKKFGIFSADAEVRRNFFQTRHYLESEHNLTEIKTFRLKKWFQDKVSELFYEHHNKEKEITRKTYKFDILFSVISAIGFGYAYWLVADSVILGVISIGLFTFYINTIRNLSNSVGSLFRNLARVYEQSLYMDDIYTLLDTKPKIINGQIMLDAKASPKIEFKNVTFKYSGSEKPIFKNLNFTINPGENIALVGENGSGKTTFVKLLSRFYDVTEGEILINGTNIKKLNLDSWYSQIALLSQEFGRYHFDVNTNIKFGNINKESDESGIIKAGKLSGADEFVQEYDNKYEQILSKRFPKGIEPSTGQWQKIALSRAFYKNANVLILDEPTSAIDPKAEFEIFEKLFDYANDKTVIIISHRFSTVRNASRIIVFDEGKIIEQGTHEELVNLNGKYKHAFELQKKGYE